MKVTHALLAGLALAIPLAAPCLAGTGRNHEVKIDADTGRIQGLVPETIVIKVGDTITWNNGEDDSDTVRVKSAPGVDGGLAFDTGPIAPERRSRAIRFTKAGKIPYRCTAGRKSLSGTIIVKAARAGRALAPGRKGAVETAPRVVTDARPIKGKRDVAGSEGKGPLGCSPHGVRRARSEKVVCAFGAGRAQELISGNPDSKKVWAGLLPEPVSSAPGRVSK